MENKSKLCERLVFARTKTGLSIENVASLLKIDINLIIKWESDDCEIQISELKKLSTLYNKNLDWFLSDKSI